MAYIIECQFLLVLLAKYCYKDIREGERKRERERERERERGREGVLLKREFDAQWERFLNFHIHI